MAETNPASSAPAPEAGEAPVERAPGQQESAPEPSKENTDKDANGAEEKPAGECISSLLTVSCLLMDHGHRVYPRCAGREWLG